MLTVCLIISFRLRRQWGHLAMLELLSLNLFLFKQGQSHGDEKIRKMGKYLLPVENNVCVRVCDKSDAWVDLDRYGADVSHVLHVRPDMGHSMKCSI